MKKLLFSLLTSIITLGAVTTSCDNVDADDRLIPVETVAPQRAVLVEDFTGQNCVNCPAAHEVLDLLVGQYGDNVIPVSIHAGHFATAVSASNDARLGLMQPEGNQLNDRWGITSYPMGVVNRSGSPLVSDSWAAAVRAQLALPTTLGIEVEARLNPANTNELLITSTFTPAADIDATLHVWIVESGIVAFQRDQTTRIPDYVHNNVYRASVNGIDGEPLKLTARVHDTVSHTIALRTDKYETWVPANLKAIVFAEGADGVIQAAQAKVAE